MFDDSIIIRRYANRKLYNNSTSRYIKLKELAEMIYNGKHFNVYDDDGNDITQSVVRSILTKLDISLTDMINIIKSYYQRD